MNVKIFQSLDKERTTIEETGIDRVIFGGVDGVRLLHVRQIDDMVEIATIDPFKIERTTAYKTNDSLFITKKTKSRRRGTPK